MPETVEREIVVDAMPETATEPCRHEHFETGFGFVRVEAPGTDTAMGWAMQLQVRCADCHEPFAFLGLDPAGAPNRAITAPDRLTAVIPIVPTSRAPRVGPRIVLARPGDLPRIN